MKVATPMKTFKMRSHLILRNGKNILLGKNIGKIYGKFYSTYYI